MRHTAIFFIWMVVGVAIADSDVPLPARRIEFASSPTDKVIFELEYLDGFSSNRITNLTFVWDGKEIVVPKRDLAEMTMVQLDSVRVFYGAFRSGPYRYVKFFFGAPVGNQPNDFVTATFFFVSQKYDNLQIDIPYDGIYTRKADRPYFTPGWFGEGTNRIAANIEELVDRMKADMKFHTELIQQWKANQALQAIGAGAPQPER